MHRVLVVDDDTQLCKLIAFHLSARGFEVTSCNSAEEALEQLHHSEQHVVVTDLRMQGLSGLDLCARLLRSRPDIPVIVATAHGSMEAAITALRAGAFDFVTKPVDPQALADAVLRAAEQRRQRVVLQRLRESLPSVSEDYGIVGESAARGELLALIRRVARLDLPVLIGGESGTGKELVARALHQAGPRPAQPFLALNCAALPENLLESELFGHVRGAFTDARSDRAGLLIKAGSGTLFLDELGELPLRLQPKLLRALQQRTVRPLGADKEQAWEARVVAATNRNLEAAVERGEFREDLYYRLNVLRIDVPPLRERREDIAICAQFFLKSFAETLQKRVLGFTPSALSALLAHPWPGNVRELQNCVQRAVALTNFDHIALEDLPEKVRGAAAAAPTATHTEAAHVSLAEHERRYIHRVLQETGGNKAEAARILGIERRTLYRKLAERELNERRRSRSG